MNTLKFPMSEDIQIRNEVDKRISEAILSTQACKVCSTALLSLTIATSKGVAEHLSCPTCGERDIIPVL